MSESALRVRIAALGKSLFDRGLSFGSAGNISARIEDGWLTLNDAPGLGLTLSASALEKFGTRIFH